MTPPLLLFAAGLGTRMRHLVHDRPKPLVEVGGKTLIDHALTLADDAGISRRVVNVHYKADMLRMHLADRSVLFSDETDKLRETGGGLRHALPLLASDPVLTLNTDAVWHGPNPINLAVSSWSDEMEALLILVPRERAVGHPGKGDFSLGSTGQLRRGGDLIYTGLQLIRTNAVAEVADDVFSMNVIWDQIARRDRLFGAVWPGRWCDVGQPESIALAEAADA